MPVLITPLVYLQAPAAPAREDALRFLPPLFTPAQVAIPVKDAHGEVTLVLDFGRFVIDSGGRLGG